MPPTMARIEYVLGIDLGSASLGWALILKSEKNVPSELLDAGVRVFDPGVDGDIDRGKDESKNKKRREGRLQRRQARRRAVRRRLLFDLLQSIGLLPPIPSGFSGEPNAGRQSVLNLLDRQLWDKWRPVLQDDKTVSAGAHVVPYYLRARALKERLEPHEFGRALYHLAQRRGYQSNRRASPRKDEEPGAVAKGIGELAAAIGARGAATLGEYFSTLDPERVKIRRRWTERRMFLREFEQVWAVQVPHHSQLLTEELKQQIHHLLFFQRPLQDNETMVGQCELEPHQKRAPWATLAAQRFRLLQCVNNLELEDATGFVRALNHEERTKILGRLETEGDQKFAALRKLIDIKPKEGSFNLERGGEKNCRGNRTACKMTRIFGDRWKQMPQKEQDSVVEQWRKTEGPTALKSIAKEKWGLSEEQSELLSGDECLPEPGYCGFSLAALEKLLPQMERGARLNAAIKEAYPSRFSGGDIYDLLPPAGDLRNPAINRAMSELRKVTNAIIRKYGKPDTVRIELARDLKKSRKDRKEIWQKNRTREIERKHAAEQISKEIKLAAERISRDGKEKFMLAAECDWLCPYTGREISMSSLFTSPEFQVEHILPLGRFPDNSFQNKTLCHVSANAEKGNRTPYEAFHGDEERYAQIIKQVKKFGNPTKLRRFQLTPEDTEPGKMLEEFTARQLNDTRYNSKQAGKYLSKLYGGRDEDGQRKVFAGSGAVTATLRQVWQLNGLLSDSNQKTRDDHRHHAVDAVVIALTSEAVIKQMAERAKSNAPIDAEKTYRPFKGLQQPWPDFVDSIRAKIDGINVSHRPNHKLNGPLHEESLYSRARQHDGKTVVHIRKPVFSLTKPMLEDIVDPAVRAAVHGKLQEVGGDIAKLESDPPFLVANDGRRIPIRRVRIRKTMTPAIIGEKERERRIQPGNNHHMAIFAALDAHGRDKRWEGVPVSLLEAMGRKRKKQPVIQKRIEGEPEWQFRFHLMLGDMVDLSGQIDGSDRSGLWRVRKIAGNEQFALVRMNDARRIKDIQAAGQWWQPRPDALRKLHCRKVEIDLLGRVHYVNEAHERGEAAGA